jgi:hypothetical protein
MGYEMVLTAGYKSLLFGMRGRCGGKIVCLTRDHVTDTAAWIRNVACVSGDYVEVEMKDGLTGGRPEIEADIETIWRVAAPDYFDTAVDRLPNGTLLGTVEVVPGCRVSPWDNE